MLEIMVAGLAPTDDGDTAAAVEWAMFVHKQRFAADYTEGRERLTPLTSATEPASSPSRRPQPMMMTRLRPRILPLTMVPSRTHSNSTCRSGVVWQDRRTLPPPTVKDCLVPSSEHVPGESSVDDEPPSGGLRGKCSAETPRALGHPDNA